MLCCLLYVHGISCSISGIVEWKISKYPLRENGLESVRKKMVYNPISLVVYRNTRHNPRKKNEKIKKKK